MTQASSKKPQETMAAPPEVSDQDENIVAGGEMPEWIDRAIPWISSALIHAGVLLLFLFAYQVVKTVVHQQPQPIIIPQNWNAHFSLHPGGHPHPGSNNNPARSARQNLKKILESKAWNTSVTPTKVNALVSPSRSSMAFIAVGPQGGTSAGGTLAPFGVPGGGMGSGPKSSFIGNGGNATRIVYILDHEGSMLENFQFLKNHLRKSIDGLVPLQSFAVIVFRKYYRILGPSRLVHATLRNKQEFFRRFSTVAPAGAAQYRYRYFARPFKAAFRLHPQIIYFLTKGAFDPKLISYIKSLNKNHAVHIYTYAFTLQDPVSRKNLKRIARENGGEYKYISRQEAND